MCFDDRQKAKEFVQMAAESPDLGLELILKQMHPAGSGDSRLIVPRVVVSLSPEQKQTLIEHAHQTRTPLLAIVEQQIKQFVGEITDE